MQPDVIALAFLWLVWSLAALAVAACVLVSRSCRRGGRINLAPETERLFGGNGNA